MSDLTARESAAVTKRAARPGYANLPNALSAFRIALVPVFAAVYLSGLENARLLAFMIFLLAGLTDIADGVIARRCRLVTSLGRLLDPLADKLMQMTALSCITYDGLVPPALLIIIAAKELALLCGGATMYRKFADVLPANRFGKCAAVAFYMAVAAVMLFDDMPEHIKLVLFGAVVLLALCAFIIYAASFVREYRARR